MRQRTGFTLIELLVVIAIIAILAAILFPVFARARAKAQQNNCLSNIKQLSLGMLMYASDADDRFPIGWEGATGTGLHWAFLIYPYVKNVQIYACPSAGWDAVWQPNGDGYGVNRKIGGTCYQINGCLGSLGCGLGCSSGTVWPPIKQAALYRPAEMIMLRGTDWSYPMYLANPDTAAPYYQGGPPWDSASYNPWYWCPASETRHNNGGNVSFCDGHAK